MAEVQRAIDVVTERLRELSPARGGWDADIEAEGLVQALAEAGLLVSEETLTAPDVARIFTWKQVCDFEAGEDPDDALIMAKLRAAVSPYVVRHDG